LVAIRVLTDSVMVYVPAPVEDVAVVVGKGDPDRTEFVSPFTNPEYDELNAGLPAP
jgi:hypothetical protein